MENGGGETVALPSGRAAELAEVSDVVVMFEPVIFADIRIISSLTTRV